MTDNADIEEVIAEIEGLFEQRKKQAQFVNISFAEGKIPTLLSHIREQQEEIERSQSAKVGSKYRRGDRVSKTKGASWTGIVVGHYQTHLTPDGVAVESENEPGSVQIYPVAALESLSGETP